ncbi:hypothetical protein OC861_006057 [Tilletia horrida]|nr:hypothetical protein OC861_006057 [Tilletia horrida]
MSEASQLNEVIDRTAAQLQTIDLEQARGAFHGLQAVQLLAGVLEAASQRGVRVVHAQDGDECDQDGVYEDTVRERTHLPKYIPAQTLNEFHILTAGFLEFPCTITETLGDNFAVLADWFRSPTQSNLVPMFEAHSQAINDAKLLRIPGFSQEPPKEFYMWLNADQIQASDGRLDVRLGTISNPAEHPAPWAVVVGTFPTAQAKVLLRDDSDPNQVSLTGELACSWFRGKPYADKIGFLDTNFFAHHRGDTEDWNSAGARSMFKLSWNKIRASGARVIILMAGSNREPPVALPIELLAGDHEGGIIWA